MILVTGCGPLGTGLVNSIENQIVKGACDASNPEIPKGFLTYDFSKEQDIFRIVDTEKPEVVILTEEIDNPEYCEKERMDAMFYNSRAQRYFAEAAQKVPARIVYKSTAMVFDGRKPGGMYTEEDDANPLNVYAETKLMGETAVDRTKDFLIARVGELYGAYPGNFASLILDSLAAGEKVELARDMYFSPIYVEDAVQALKELTVTRMSGFYNVAGHERLSHFEFGQKIAQAFGYREDLLVPMSMAELNLLVRMPQDVSLDVSKLGMLVNVRSADEGLSAMKTAMSAVKK